jgi:hypothetical protein
MVRVGWKEFEDLAKSFFEKECGVRLLQRMPVTLASGESHKFDLVSESENIVVECKNHTWTKSGNYPSAKTENSQRAIGLLRDSSAQRKIIVFYDDFSSGKSLVEVFVRRNRKLLTGIEVWRYLEGHFEIFANLPADHPNISEEDSRLVEQVMIRLNEAASRCEGTASVLIPALAYGLGVSSQKLVRLGPQICQGLRENGIQAVLGDGRFSIRKT